MKEKNQEKLLFIYNANSGTRNAILDSMHKVLSPKTYECKLCEITFGVFTEKRVWKRFRKQSVRQMSFLHKDEFLIQYKSKFGYKFDFPIVLIENINGLSVLISADELKHLQKPEDLIHLIKQRM